MIWFKFIPGVLALKTIGNKLNFMSNEINTIGDSHASFSFSYFENIKANVYWLGPWTMYRVGRDMVNLSSYIKNKNLPTITSFGEIDIRCHLSKHNNVKELVEKYIDALNFNKPFFKKIIIFAPVPPTDRDSTEENEDYPYAGTNTERVQIHREMVSNLKKQSDFPVIDVTPYYANEDGLLIKELSDNNVHIKVTKFVEKEVMKLLG